MKNPAPLVQTAAQVRKAGRRPLWRRGSLHTTLVVVFASHALSPRARAACQEGCDLAHVNTFLGEEALNMNSVGSANTAIGYIALAANIDGFDNTATGSHALGNNTLGFQNTATGSSALANNVDGSNNTATGIAVLQNNRTGSDNTASGVSALCANSIGRANTATGVRALLGNTTGINNTATGYQALLSNTTGSNNIALGDSAGINLTTGSNNIDIGNVGAADEAGTIRIGSVGTHAAAFIAGIRTTPITGVAVGITTDGQLGVRGSSARFKEAIKPIDKASEAIFSLQPVTFRYKKTLDLSAQPQFGLVAEQVAKVDPDLVVSDEKGKPFSVRYEEVNAMLLKEFLKEHRKLETQEATITGVESTVAKQDATITSLKSIVAQQQKDLEETVARQEQQVGALVATLKAQASQLRRVSEQLA
jgi:trimeric autotransporter adhesin